MQEQMEIAADLVGLLRRLADGLEEFVQSSKGEKLPTESKAAVPHLEEVRAALAKLSVAGHSAAVKSLIARFGADKLSDIVPEHYAALLKEAERIGS